MRNANTYGAAGALCMPVAVGALLLAGCPTGSSLPPIGVSGLEAPPPASASASSSAVVRWAHWASVRDWTRANTRRFSSTGHLFGRYDADVRVNDVAAAGYATIAPGRALPVGAIVVKVHVPKGTAEGSSAPAPMFAMEKGSEGWTYVETDDDGKVLRRGRLQPCASCHAHVASQDELFGVPLTGR